MCTACEQAAQLRDKHTSELQPASQLDRTLVATRHANAPAAQSKPPPAAATAAQVKHEHSRHADPLVPGETRSRFAGMLLHKHTTHTASLQDRVSHMVTDACPRTQANMHSTEVGQCSCVHAPMHGPPGCGQARCSGSTCAADSGVCRRNKRVAHASSLMRQCHLLPPMLCRCVNTQLQCRRVCATHTNTHMTQGKVCPKVCPKDSNIACGIPPRPTHKIEFLQSTA